MEDKTETVRSRLDRLMALMEMAHHHAPEDRARLERTIQLSEQAHQAITRARQAAQRARHLREEVKISQVGRWIELATALTELRIIRDNTPK